MIAGPFEQRNPYEGSPPRPWVLLRLTASDGASYDLKLLADTGNPCGLIISITALQILKLRDAPNISSNFGPLQGGWVRLDLPEFGLDQLVIGYAGDSVVTAAKAS